MSGGIRRHRCANRCNQDEPHQSDHAVGEDHDCGARLRSGRARRVANADHVASDVARQKIIEEERDEERAEERPRGNVDLLGIEKQVPSPDASEHVREVHAERGRQPYERRPLRRRPQARRVDLRKEDGEQDDADGHLEREERVVARG